jgi:zinc protease
MIGWATAAAIGFAAATAEAIEIERVLSPGGIEAWLVHEPSIPIIAVEMMWRSGARFDPADKAGLANLVSGLIDEGAGELDSQAFQTRLKDFSISLSFDAARDSFDGSLRTLSKNRQEAFHLLGQALGAPRFDPEPVERIRQQILTHISQDRTNPRSIAGRTWFRTAFPEHPYGNPTRGYAETVQAIDATDLRNFVDRHLARDNLVIAVVGDITAAELAPLLDQTFGALPAAARLATPVDVWPAEDVALRVVEQDTPQSVVIFGARGIKRNDPDYFAAYVMIYILGGDGLTSRLAESVRERRGLTYSIYSYLNPMSDTALYLGGLSSSNQTVAEAVKLARAELVRLRDHGVSAEELQDAKTYLNGSFPLSLTSNGRIAGLLVAMQHYGLGIDYLDHRADYINAVTRADVKRVAERLLKPENLIIVVVGKPVGMGEGG